MKKTLALLLASLLLLSPLSALMVRADEKTTQPTFVALSEEELKEDPSTPASTEEKYPLEDVYKEILEAKPEKTDYPFILNTYNYEKEPVEFEVKAVPERVWAQNQNNIEVMLALGLEDKIVGCCGLDDNKLPEEMAKKAEKLNFYEKMPTFEEVLSLEPDFILGWYSTFDEKRLNDVDFFHDRGIGTYMSLNSACRGKSPQSIYHECVDILTIGKIFDVQEEARALVDQILDEKERINEYLEDHDRKTVAVIEDEGGVYRVYSELTLGGNVAINGGANLAVGRDAYTLRISAEDLITANPEAVFLVYWDGFTIGDDAKEYTGDELVQYFCEDPKFASLQAVKNNMVFAVNLTGFYCSGLHTLDGILEVAKNLYPELYEEELKAEAEKEDKSHDKKDK